MELREVLLVLTDDSTFKGVMVGVNITTIYVQESDTPPVPIPWSDVKVLMFT